MDRDENENNRNHFKSKKDATKQRTDSSMSNTNNNKERESNTEKQQQPQQNGNKRNNKKPEMARYQPPGNRLNKTIDKPPTPPLLNDNSRPKSASAIKKKSSFKQDPAPVNQTDSDYTRKSPGSRNETPRNSGEINQQNQANVSLPITNSQTVDEQEPSPVRIPISIIKTNFKGGILKLNSVTLNEMNNSKKIKNEANESFSNENTTDHLNRQLLQNHNNNHNDNNNNYNYNRGDTTQNANYKMLFDPNNPNKPIYVKEKQTNMPNNHKTTSTQQANTYRRQRSESKRQNEINNETQPEPDPPKQSASTPNTTTNTKTNTDIIKVQGIIQSIKPLEQSLNSLIDSFDIKTQSIHTFNSNIVPIRKN